MMPHPNTPWIGLAALVAMFVLPFLPAWLFEGPRKVKHYPRRHVCGLCGAPWTADHACVPDRVPDRVPARVADRASERRPLRGQLRRVRPSTELVRRSARPSRIDTF
jgi:hypothetical protein